MASRPSNIKISDLPVEVVLQLMKDYGKRNLERFVHRELICAA